jgi:hypothetical protein
MQPRPGRRDPGPPDGDPRPPRPGPDLARDRSMDARTGFRTRFLAGLLVVVVLVTGACARPSRLELAASSPCRARVWEAISAAWSPVPSLARDEGLLTLLLRARARRPARDAADRRRPPLRRRGRRGRGRRRWRSRRRSSCASAATRPTTSTPAASRFRSRTRTPRRRPFLVGFWPAVVLAAQRGRSVWIRAFALAAATAISSGWLTRRARAACSHRRSRPSSSSRSRP